MKIKKNPAPQTSSLSTQTLIIWAVWIHFVVSPVSEYRHQVRVPCFVGHCNALSTPLLTHTESGTSVCQEVKGSYLFNLNRINLDLTKDSTRLIWQQFPTSKVHHSAADVVQWMYSLCGHRAQTSAASCSEELSATRAEPQKCQSRWKGRWNSEKRGGRLLPAASLYVRPSAGVHMSYLLGHRFLILGNIWQLDILKRGVNADVWIAVIFR